MIKGSQTFKSNRHHFWIDTACLTETLKATMPKGAQGGAGRVENEETRLHKHWDCPSIRIN